MRAISAEFIKRIDDIKGDLKVQFAYLPGDPFGAHWEIWDSVSAMTEMDYYEKYKRKHKRQIRTG